MNGAGLMVFDQNIGPLLLLLSLESMVVSKYSECRCSMATVYSCHTNLISTET
jgi:hypothetical protein